MKKTTKYLLFAACLATILVYGCKKSQTAPTGPSVTTSSLINITTTSATAGGTITGDGGSAITASGIVLSKYHTTPTITDTVMMATATAGSFTVNLSNLEFGTTYYLRAYATNSIGTGYGDVVTLNTTNDTTKVRFTYNGQQVIYGVISSPTTGKKWMDRNLGASQAATSPADTLSFGDLFQWGRLADGHQLKSSNKVTTTSSTDVPGHNNYIKTNTLPTDPYDWRIPQNNNLWQGVSGVNNPCPAGWRVPTQAEWAAEKAGGISEINSAFSILKLPVGGYRSLSGAIAPPSYGGWYWSSTTAAYGSANNYFFAFDFNFNTSASSAAGVTDRGQGMSIRCIKD